MCSGYEFINEHTHTHMPTDAALLQAQGDAPPVFLDTPNDELQIGAVHFFEGDMILTVDQMNDVVRYVQYLKYS